MLSPLLLLLLFLLVLVLVSVLRIWLLLLLFHLSSFADCTDILSCGIRPPVDLSDPQAGANKYGMG